MKRPRWPLWPPLKYLAWLLAATMVFAWLLSAILTEADSAAGAVPEWAAPTTMTLRRVSDAPVVQEEPNLLNNTDCTPLTYRLTSSQTMRAGCFGSSALGWVNTDSNTVIFNGTDEALPLIPYAGQPIFVPWPGGLGLITLMPAATGGAYLGLYANPLGVLQDQRNGLGQLTAKRLTAGPEVAINDAAGEQLIVNPQTLAFSSNGSWLVAETLTGSFVRVNLATLAVTAFAPSIVIKGDPALLKAQVAVSDNGRYVAIDSDAAGSLAVYDLSTCDGPGASQYEHCRAYDYVPFVQQQLAGFQKLRHLRFVNDGLLSFVAYTNGSAANGVYELAPTASITASINYLALGDSYTSGEGAFDYETGTDTADSTCHLSIHAYPLLLTQDLFGDSGGHSVACSGAVINDVGSTSASYQGQVKNSLSFAQLQQTRPSFLEAIMDSYLPGYVAQQRFVQQYQPLVTSVSVGGDDIGFGDILRKCVMPHVSLHAGANTCYRTYEDRLEVTQLIDRTVPRWVTLYRQLQAEAPNSHLYVIGYPLIADPNGNCAFNVHLNRNELVFAEELTDYLNGAIAQAASAAGVTYVDISQALVGHRLCEASSYDVAVNGLTAGNDGGILGIKVLGRESYHPNALGQALMEQAILQQTHNLSVIPGAAGPAPEQPATDQTDEPASGGDMLDVPKSGRPVNDLVPDNTMTADAAIAGSQLALRVSGPTDGLKANTSYDIRLDGTGGPAIATAMSDDTGNIAANLTLPDDTAAGEHTIDITGQDQAGEPVDVTQPLYVPVTDNDADGDGVPNYLDTCPAAVNSGQDRDHDGIDDTCDAFIGSTAPSSSAGSGFGSGPGGATATRASGGTAGPSQSKPGDGAAAAGRSLMNGTLLRAPLPQTSTRTADQTARRLLLRTGRARRPFGIVLLAVLMLALWLLVRLRHHAGRLPWRPKVWLSGISKSGHFYYNGVMIWVRRGLVYLLALILFVSLVGLAVTVSTEVTLRRPAQLESWLSQPQFYNRFITSVSGEVEQTAGNGQKLPAQANATIQQAARTAFPAQLIRNNINHFLGSNYAWLQGKTNSPAFTVDLTSAEQAFIQQIAQSTQARLSNLPDCSATESVQLSAGQLNPLTVPCIPLGLDAQTVAAETTQEIENSGGLLGNPVLTAASLSMSGNNSGESYYQQFSAAPTLYRLGTELPWLLGFLAFLCALGVLFLALGKRRGVRSIGVVFALAGLLLIAVKFAAGAGWNRLSTQLRHDAGANQFQQALVDLLHLLEKQLVKLDLWFGIAFAVVALCLFGGLWFSRRRGAGRPPQPRDPEFSVIEPPRAPRPTPLPNLKQPPRPKPPRLIQ